MSGFEYLLYGSFAVIPFMWWYKVKKWDYEGLSYNPLSDTSFPVPSFLISGNKWTENRLLKRMFPDSENSVKYDNFAFAPTFKRHVSPFKKLFFKPAEVHVKPSDLVESVVMFAPMKGGKTTTLYSWLLQPWYNRAIINEQKAGDFVSKLYNKRKDYILSYYDERAHVWDVLSEGLQIIEFYILNSLNSATGDNPNFFTNDAKKRYKEVARLTIDIEDPLEKWDFFITELEKIFAEIEKGDSKSAKDVSSTMEQIIEPLKLTQFQLKNGKRAFTIKEFFTKKHQTKLFMVNHDEYTVTLAPLFTAFTACVAMVQAGMPETKDDLTFYCLDEYLSLRMNYDARLILHTKTRSKGSCVVSASQFSPEKKEIEDLLTSSAHSFMFFSVKNDRTRELLSKKVGKWEYKIYSELNGQTNERTAEKEILDWSEIDKLSNEFKHITYIPGQSALYVGISDHHELEEKNKPFVYDPLVDEFYRSQNKEYLHKKNKDNAVKSTGKKYAEQQKKKKSA